MTDSVHSIVHAELGDVEKAFEYTRRSVEPFVRPPFEQFAEARTGGAFTFLTGHGGFLQEFLYGYSGLRLRADRIALAPILPVELECITCNGCAGGAVSSTWTSVPTALRCGCARANGSLWKRRARCGMYRPGRAHDLHEDALTTSMRCRGTRRFVRGAEGARPGRTKVNPCAVPSSRGPPVPVSGPDARTPRATHRPHRSPACEPQHLRHDQPAHFLDRLTNAGQPSAVARGIVEAHHGDVPTRDEPAVAHSVKGPHRKGVGRRTTAVGGPGRSSSSAISRVPLDVVSAPRTSRRWLPASRPCRSMAVSQPRARASPTLDPSGQPRSPIRR